MSETTSRHPLRWRQMQPSASRKKVLWKWTQSRHRQQSQQPSRQPNIDIWTEKRTYGHMAPSSSDLACYSRVHSLVLCDTWIGTRITITYQVYRNCMRNVSPPQLSGATLSDLTFSDTPSAHSSYYLILAIVKLSLPFLSLWQNADLQTLLICKNLLYCDLICSLQCAVVANSTVIFTVSSFSRVLILSGIVVPRYTVSLSILVFSCLVSWYFPGCRHYRITLEYSVLKACGVYMSTIAARLKADLWVMLSEAKSSVVRWHVLQDKLRLTFSFLSLYEFAVDTSWNFELIDQACDLHTVKHQLFRASNFREIRE